MDDQGSLIIGAFFDGRPGHEKQTQGIIEALKRIVAIDVISIQVLRKGIAGQLADLVKYFIGLPISNKPSLKKCNLLIGTGTPTHLPMLYYKKEYDIPAITCMTPATFLRKHFDLIFSPYHDNAPAEDNIFITIGPPNLNCNKKKHTPERILILIGGTDPRSHRWDTKHIKDCVCQLIVADTAKTYILSSSPRTPEDTVETLVELAKKYDNVSFFDFRDTPSGWVEKEYAACAEVWVTGDSISMVYEALSSGCRVGIIPVQWSQVNSRFVRSENYLLKHGLVIHLDSYMSEKKIWEENKELNEAQRCAEEIIRRFL